MSDIAAAPLLLLCCAGSCFVALWKGRCDGPGIWNLLIALCGADRAPVQVLTAEAAADFAL
ncbi:hypothetical protein M514_11702 [Trichuris suis]|uniref:Uncharacterized protein n=1 Tax=Trichuris suis TaxID=68888 RepID=A0A085NCH4_9BILA|nr:hypothetical protein M513_11702 [Trichuris suis]KFD67170.1 hypothetical protein M514_11702 [Trichuris suis]